MENRIAENIIAFLKRVELKGDEAFAYCESIQALEKIMTQPEGPNALIADRQGENARPTKRTAD